jgi:4-cresol dehydrogenase (hydroxylating)
MDVPDLPAGSVLGNAMDRGVGYTPYADHFGAHCGMEVVMADGQVVRTGQGAMPNGKGWHTYEHSLGPSIDGLFCQGNLGICISMGFKLMPSPGGILPFLITIPSDESLECVFLRATDIRTSLF